MKTLFIRKYWTKK